MAKRLILYIILFLGIIIGRQLFLAEKIDDQIFTSIIFYRECLLFLVLIITWETFIRIQNRVKKPANKN